MPNLQYASPVGRDEGIHSYVARTVVRSWTGQATSWDKGIFSAVMGDGGMESACTIEQQCDETRPRGRRFHTVSCQKLSLTYQFGELRLN